MQLSKQVLKEHFVTKYDSKKCTCTLAAGYKGITINLGSRKSAIIYDKAFERGFYEEIEKGFSWTRREC